MLCLFQNFRIMEEPKLEATSKDHLLHPLMGRGIQIILSSTLSNHILKTFSDVPGKGIPVNDCSCYKKYLSYIKREVLDTSVNTLKWEETIKNFHFMIIDTGSYRTRVLWKLCKTFQERNQVNAFAIQYSAFDLSSTLFSLDNKGTGMTG